MRGQRPRLLTTEDFLYLIGGSSGAATCGAGRPSYYNINIPPLMARPFQPWTCRQTDCRPTIGRQVTACGLRLDPTSLFFVRGVRPRAPRLLQDGQGMPCPYIAISFYAVGSGDPTATIITSSAAARLLRQRRRRAALRF